MSRGVPGEARATRNPSSSFFSFFHKLYGGGSQPTLANHLMIPRPVRACSAAQSAELLRGKGEMVAFWGADWLADRRKSPNPDLRAPN